MAERARVTKSGAVLLGDSVACDAHDPSRPLRVVTHAHADHLYGLRSSLKRCEKVLMTKATRDLTETLNGSLKLKDSASVKTLEYGKVLKYKDEKISLLKADHILGAAQVLVEDAGGIRIVWTGDFRLDGTPVVECDVLVVEATYGSPSCRRNFDVDVRELLVSMIEKRFEAAPSTCLVTMANSKKLCKFCETQMLRCLLLCLNVFMRLRRSVRNMGCALDASRFPLTRMGMNF